MKRKLLLLRVMCTLCVGDVDETVSAGGTLP